MAYSVKVINSGYFGDTERWVHVQARDEEDALLSEEIWTREDGGTWERKDCLAGDEVDGGLTEDDLEQASAAP